MKVLMVVFISIALPIVSILASPSYAQELIDYDKGDIRSIKVDIDKDGIEEEISAISGELEPGHYICIIKVADGENESTKAIEIDMFSSYNLSVIEIHSSLEPYIGVNYGFGAHGNELTLLRYNEGNYTMDIVGKFISDRPSIKIEDVDNDGVKEIVTIMRDYEINPVEESYIQIFEYVDEGKWRVKSVYRTATDEYMTEDWDKDKVDIEAYKANMKKFGMYEPERWKEE